MLGVAGAYRCAHNAPRCLTLDAATLARRFEILTAALRGDAAGAQLSVRRAPGLLFADANRYQAVHDALRSALFDHEDEEVDEEVEAVVARVMESVVRRAPSVVAGISPATLAVRVAFLREELGLDSERAARVVRARPVLLQLSVDRTLRPTLLWLARRLRLLEEEESETTPQRSLNELDRASRETLQKLVVAYPSVLGLSVKANLAPKLDALAAYAANDPHEARTLVNQLVLKCPSVLGYSLHARLIPRLETLRANGLEFAELAYFLTLTPLNFDAALAKRLESRAAPPNPRDKRQSTTQREDLLELAAGPRGSPSASASGS